MGNLTCTAQKEFIDSIPKFIAYCNYMRNAVQQLETSKPTKSWRVKGNYVSPLELEAFFSPRQQISVIKQVIKMEF